MNYNKQCVEGTHPVWQEITEDCRYCGTVGSPQYKKCVDCHVYSKIKKVFDLYDFTIKNEITEIDYEMLRNIENEQ